MKIRYTTSAALVNTALPFATRAGLVAGVAVAARPVAAGEVVVAARAHFVRGVARATHGQPATAGRSRRAWAHRPTR